MKKQRGAAMVEMAIIAGLFFMILFGIIEFARAIFTYTSLVEATRRGARVAAVCPVASDAIDYVKQIATFDVPGGSNALLGLSLGDIAVNYYDSNMAPATQPTSVADHTAYDNIAFVEVSIPAYTHQLIIPFFANQITFPPMTTLMPAESLGRVTSENPVTKRCCTGSGYSAQTFCST